LIWTSSVITEPSRNKPRRSGVKMVITFFLIQQRTEKAKCQ
jgi:hypothetical protein